MTYLYTASAKISNGSDKQWQTVTKKKMTEGIKDIGKNILSTPNRAEYNNCQADTSYLFCKSSGLKFSGKVD